MAVPEEGSTTPPLTLEERFVKLFKFILTMKMEAIFFFYATPGYLCVIALATLPLEKACRINLGYDDDICSNLNNLTIKATCGSIYEFQAQETPPDMYETELNKVLKTIGQANNFTDHDLEVVKGVCIAETESQKLQISINQLRAPLGLLGLIVIVYAGPLGDKYNRKKPYLLLPMVGELICVSAYLTTSVFKSQVPMEFHMYLERIVYALSGSLTLMLMGVFSFLAAETAEADRTFRFGVFTVFLSGLGIVVQPFSDVIFIALGYVNLFLLCVLIHALGVVFIIFFVEEMKVKPVDDAAKPPVTDGAENPAYDGSTLELRDRSNGEQQSPTAALAATAVEAEKDFKGLVKHGFQLTIQSFKIFQNPRPNSGRPLLVITMISYVLIVFASAEAELRIPYGRKQWGWATEFSNYYSYISFIIFAGNIIVTGFFINFLKLSDPALAIIAFIATITNRSILTVAKTSFWIYTAATVDMFQSTPVIAIRSLLSKVVKPEELGTAYSVMGITDTVIVPLGLICYNTLYEETIETYPPSFLLLTIAVFAINLFIFIRIKFMSGRFMKAEKKDAEAVANNNEKANEKTTDAGTEVSRM